MVTAWRTSALPKDMWQELFDAGRIGYHPVFPGQARLRSAERDIDARGRTFWT